MLDDDKAWGNGVFEGLKLRAGRRIQREDAKRVTEIQRNCIGITLEDMKRVSGVKAQRESQATRFNEKNSRGGVTDT